MKEVDGELQTAGFDKTKRLLTSSHYTAVMKNGKRVYNPLFLLSFFPNSLSGPRVGMTVSKKVSKRAVERNRIKRLIREYFRLNQHTLASYDFVFIAHPKAAHTEHSVIVNALATLMAKAHQQINHATRNS